MVSKVCSLLILVPFTERQTANCIWCLGSSRLSSILFPPSAGDEANNHRSLLGSIALAALQVTKLSLWAMYVIFAGILCGHLQRSKRRAQSWISYLNVQL